MHTRLRLRPLRLRRPIPYVFFLNVSFLNIDSSCHSRRGRSSISSSRSSSSSGPPSRALRLLHMPSTRAAAPWRTGRACFARDLRRARPPLWSTAVEADAAGTHWRFRAHRAEMPPPGGINSR